MISHLNVLQQPQTNVTISQRYCGVAPVTGAGSGMCVSTPSKESQIICFLPLEIIKTLTRICANFARPGSLVCACLASAVSSHSSSLLFPFSQSPGSVCRPFVCQGISPPQTLQAEQRPAGRCGNARVYGPGERSSHDYPTDVSARVEWNRSCCSDQAAPCHQLLFDLNFSSDQSENESVENERNISN